MAVMTGDAEESVFIERLLPRRGSDSQCRILDVPDGAPARRWQTADNRLF
jgi:hypothetical protein